MFYTMSSKIEGQSLKRLRLDRRRARRENETGDRRRDVRYRRHGSATAGPALRLDGDREHVRTGLHDGSGALVVPVFCSILFRARTDKARAKKSLPL